MIRLILLSLTCLFMFNLGQAQQWEQRSDLPDVSGRHHPVTWGIDGFGYAATGTDRNLQPTNDFFRYDATSDQWERLSAFPGAARSFAIGTVYQGRGYLGFGATATDYLGDIWRFDPADGSWEQLTVCPCEPRRHPSFVITDDRIFVGLGDGPSGNLNDWWTYDLNTDKWTRQADLPGPPRHHPFQFVAGDQVFAGMGHGQGVIYKDWYRFNVSTDEWEPVADFPGEARVAGTQFDHKGFGYVLSGDGDDHNFMPTGEFWKYDASTDSWEQLPPHPGVSRWAPGSFVVRDQVYFLAGQDRVEREIMFDMWSFPLEDATGIGTPRADLSAIELSPNPVSEHFQLQGVDEGATIQLFSAAGIQIGQFIYRGTEMNVSGLSAGTYFLRIKDQRGQFQYSRFLKI